MNKVAHYLQEHLVGEVITSGDARRYFSTDGSVLTVTPALVMYPRNENDVRKAARFSWQLAERNRIIPITPRGVGANQSGAALGTGIIMAFPAHMNRILEFDPKSGQVTVEPGLNYGKLQQALHTHGRFLPPYPAAVEYSTIGGSIADNASGEKSVKYGSTKNYVKSLRVVLANGEVIVTGRLSKRELSKKMGLASFEGEVYRALDKLIEEHREIINRPGPAVTKNTAGYNLREVLSKDGSFDLTPLFLGSQGTLGIITEATLSTEPYNPETTLIAAFFDDIQTAEQAIMDIRTLSELPSALEVVDGNLLSFIDRHNPNQLRGVVDKPFAKLVVLIEFDNANGRMHKKLVKKTQKILDKYEVNYRTESDEQAKEQLWKIRHSAAFMSTFSDGNIKALPLIEDGVVPPERFKELLDAVYDLLKRNNVEPAVWGHIGDGNIHLQPLLDLSQVGDRQKAFRLLDDYYKLVISLGGTTSGEHSDGRIRAPYLKALCGDELYELFGKVKQIFDPYSILNPGVKINVTLEDIKPLLRHEYTLSHLYDHLPRL